MLDIIQRHLEAIENLQADLEGRITAALGDVTPEEILARTDELPQEIADELRNWIEQFMLQPLVDESVRFLADMEQEDEVEVDDEKVRSLVVVLLDHFHQTVLTVATAAFSQIASQVDLQERLGRSREAILADMRNETAGIGAAMNALQKKLVAATDTFVSSAGGVVVISANIEKLTWVTVLDRRVCADCDPRHGASRSGLEWVEMGLPRTGWSICGGYCRCILVPTSAYERSGGFSPVVRERRK